jgi:hypothetical protein
MGRARSRQIVLDGGLDQTPQGDPPKQGDERDDAQQGAERERPEAEFDWDQVNTF